MANITCIPLEILEKILTSLPVKSLQSCRCVSKTWRSFISEPSFVRKQLSHASQPENVSSKTLFFGNQGESYPVELTCAPLSTLQPRYIRPCPFGDPKCCHWVLVASCNGLLCLWIEEAVFIWNPCLKINAYTTVLSPTGAPNFMHYHGVYLDFGYDSTADDYKLFLLTKGDRPWNIETRVYSLRSESWTKLEDFPEVYNWPHLSAFVNNSFHWIVYRESVPTIFSFDLSKGKYGDEVVPLPEHSDGQRLELCVLDGMLGVTVRWAFGSSRHLVVWVMKDYYCRRGEWTKILDITIGNDDDFRCMDVRPFYVDENGEVKVGVFSQSWLGSPARFIINDQSRRLVHVESLISPVPAAAAAAISHRDDDDDDDDDDETESTDGDYEGYHKFFLLSRDKYVHNDV